MTQGPPSIVWEERLQEPVRGHAQLKLWNPPKVQKTCNWVLLNELVWTVVLLLIKKVPRQQAKVVIPRKDLVLSRQLQSQLQRRKFHQAHPLTRLLQRPLSPRQSRDKFDPKVLLAARPKPRQRQRSSQCVFGLLPGQLRPKILPRNPQRSLLLLVIPPLNSWSLLQRHRQAKRKIQTKKQQRNLMKKKIPRRRLPTRCTCDTGDQSTVSFLIILLIGYPCSLVITLSFLIEVGIHPMKSRIWPRGSNTAFVSIVHYRFNQLTCFDSDLLALRCSAAANSDWGFLQNRGQVETGARLERSGT